MAEDKSIILELVNKIANAGKVMDFVTDNQFTHFGTPAQDHTKKFISFSYLRYRRVLGAGVWVEKNKFTLMYNIALCVTAVFVIKADVGIV
jgi:hypothetical protein